MTRTCTLLLSLFAFSACSQVEKKYESPEGYNFNDPLIFKMPDDLREISGIAFYPGDKNTMYAIQDEEGKLFYWQNGSPDNLKQLPFGKHGDYEDIGITKNYTVVLRSDGTLFSIPMQEIRSGNIRTVQETKGLIPAGEYEGLYADAAGDDLYILCKNCKADKKTGRLSGYILHLDEQGTPALKSIFGIDTEGILKKASKQGLKPSALARHPKTNEWYLLSSVNKMLIIADEAWKPKKVITLNSSLFPQPEGISFDIDNNLYISNEAGNTPEGTVLKFRYGGASR